MTTPRKRKPSIGTRLMWQFCYGKDEHFAKTVDRAVAAHTRKVCKPLVEALRDIADGLGDLDTASTQHFARITLVESGFHARVPARIALAKYKEIK